MEAEKDCQLDGDILDSVLSRVPTVDLIQAVHVSRSWRRSALASIHRRRLRPWLLLHLLNPRRPAGLSTFYDPCTGSWHTLPHVTPLPPITCPFLPLALPLQPLSATWPLLPPPPLHRRDTIAALVGPHLLLAGGTCAIGYRTCEVESLSLSDSSWKICQPMPELLRHSAAATWLSAAASDRRMYIAERGNAAENGRVCWYEPETDQWGDVRPVRLGAGRFFRICGIGMAPCSAAGEDRLYVVGSGEDGGLEIWMVEIESLDGLRIGWLPAEVAERIAGEGTGSSPAVGFTNVGSFGYLYGLDGKGEAVACDLSVGNWSWEEIGWPRMMEEDPTARVVLGCGKPTLGNLKAVYTGENRSGGAKS